MTRLWEVLWVALSAIAVGLFLAAAVNLVATITT